MRYTGNICNGCKTPFTENDDVVVCPECATPQHRHCYEEKGECVNAHLHGEGYQWKSDIPQNLKVQASTLSVDEKKQEGKPLICPNCRNANPAGSTQCRVCGMKFTVFGKNIVEMLEDDGAKKEENAPAFTSEAHNGSEQSTEPAIKGPYPHDDTTLGFKTNYLGVFMRGNADYYIKKFKRSETTGRTGFNFAAFFFSPYWFFFRKMFRPGIVFMTIQLCLSIVLTPFTAKFLDVMAQAEAVGETLTYEMLYQMLLPVSKEVTVCMIGVVITFIINLIAGFVANKLYKKQVEKAMKSINNLRTRNERLQFFSKVGGVSWLFVAIAYFGEYLLSLLAASIM